MGGIPHWSRSGSRAGEVACERGWCWVAMDACKVLGTCVPQIAPEDNAAATWQAPAAESGSSKGDDGYRGRPVAANVSVPLSYESPTHRSLLVEGVEIDWMEEVAPEEGCTCLVDSRAFRFDEEALERFWTPHEWVFRRTGRTNDLHIW